MRLADARTSEDQLRIEDQATRTDQARTALEQLRADLGSGVPA